MLVWSLHRPLLVFKPNIENDDANQYGREVRSTGTPGHRVKEIGSWW